MVYQSSSLAEGHLRYTQKPISWPNATHFSLHRSQIDEDEDGEDAGLQRLAELRSNRRPTGIEDVEPDMRPGGAVVRIPRPGYFWVSAPGRLGQED